jgi:hypothetical protein
MIAGSAMARSHIDEQQWASCNIVSKRDPLMIKTDDCKKISF